MSPRSEFYAALWSMSSVQNILTAVSVLISLSVFVIALVRVCLMDGRYVESVSSMPLDQEQEAPHV